MSRALDNRLPPLESGLEYAPRKKFRDEGWEGDDEGELGGDDKGELGAVIQRRATLYTRPNRKDVAVTSRCAPPTDIMDLDTDEKDAAESTKSPYENLDFL